MAAYEELLSAFKATAPQWVLAKEGSPEFGDLFNKWTGDVMKEFGVGSWDEIPSDQLAAIEFNPDYTTATTTTGPAEQQIFNKVVPGLLNQIDGDAARQKLVTDLTTQTNAGFGNLQTVLQGAAAVFDGNAYLRANPDLLAEYKKQVTDGTIPKDEAGNPLSPDAWGKLHYETYGKNEGRGPTYTSEVLRNQNRVADDTATALIGSAGAAAATRSGALTTMTTAQLANLETSLATQRAALEREVLALQGNATAAAASRRAALAQQLEQLTAAQAPVSEARLRAAESEVTGINQGLEGTRDQLRADAARDGFIGPSTMSEGALARAAIGARQDAARTLGGARVTNATDTRAIGNYGANQGFSISDVYAGDLQRTGDYGASGGARLTASGAELGRGINDAGATGQFGITSNLATQTQDAANRAAAAKAAYSDQLFPNAVNSAQITAGLPGALGNSLTSLIPLGTAGTKDALGVLNWWGANPAPPTSTAVTGLPNQAGNQIGNLGTGLAGAAFQVGNANKWWQTPTTTKPATVTANNDGVMTDWQGYAL